MSDSPEQQGPLDRFVRQVTDFGQSMHPGRLKQHGQPQRPEPEEQVWPAWFTFCWSLALVVGLGFMLFGFLSTHKALGFYVGFGLVFLVMVVGWIASVIGWARRRASRDDHRRSPPGVDGSR